MLQAASVTVVQCSMLTRRRVDEMLVNTQRDWMHLGRAEEEICFLPDPLCNPFRHFCLVNVRIVSIEPPPPPPLPSVRRCICRWIYVVLAALSSSLGNGRDNLLDLLLVLVHQP